MWLSAADALLDNVGTELLLGQFADLALEALTHGCCEGSIVEIQDVLNHVVAERILYKMETMGRDLANEVNLLEANSVVNAATMAMSANGDAVLAYSIKDELSLHGLEVVQTLLNDVVAVQILDEIYNLS